MADVNGAYDQFQRAANETWLADYRAAVSRAQMATEQEFRSEEFQRWLWEMNGISSIGPGASVTVQGAYRDPAVIDALWQLREMRLPEDPVARGKRLDAEFERVLNLVTPRHNARRPSARLARLFAALLPREVLCLVDGRRTAQFRQWLGLPSHRMGMIGQHVLSRDYLRQQLGPEADLRDAVLHSQFSWFVWDHIIDVEPDGSSIPKDEQDSIATDRPRLKVLPARMQRKGMFYITNNVDVLLSIVRAAENGIEREDLLQQVAEDAPFLNLASRRNMLAQAVALGLIALQGGVYTITSAARTIVEGADPAEVLVPTFVRTVFGFAQILDDLKREKTLTRRAIAERARAYYPRWTTDFAPNALVAWLRDLKLADVNGAGALATVSLSESGEYWASGLPDDLKSEQFLLKDMLPAAAAAEVADEPAPDLRAALKFAPIDDVVARFKTDPAVNGFVFSEEQIRLLHAALHAMDGKRFVLLAGLSGTGKTSMAKAYAHAYCASLGLNPAPRYLQVAVWPDWTDPSGLLGFVNPLSEPPSFQGTPALSFLLQAAQDPENPYFLCLDEMNLARVEHYFAPFLSAMEGNAGELAIHAGGDTVDEVPAKLAWPRNLFIIGTVNMDETTHPFSDKVLDRAFTFEFWEVDLDGWLRKAEQRLDQAVLSHIMPVLRDLYAALRPARRHFGYRSCEEVAGFCCASDGLPISVTLDNAVLAKILPKIRGDAGGALPGAIANAIAVCDTNNLVNSKAKLESMKAGLGELGMVRFWS